MKVFTFLLSIFFLLHSSSAKFEWRFEIDNLDLLVFNISVGTPRSAKFYCLYMIWGSVIRLISAKKFKSGCSISASTTLFDFKMQRHPGESLTRRKFELFQYLMITLLRASSTWQKMKDSVDANGTVNGVVGMFLV